MMDELIVDFMDFTNEPNGDINWIQHIKLPFPKYCWTSAHEDKEAVTTGTILEAWLNTYGRVKRIRCNNGTEFKGKKYGDFKSVYQKWGILIINGRGYYPETQGTVEIANRTFKRRLRALQTARSTRHWVEFLPEITIIINTSPLDALLTLEKRIAHNYMKVVERIVKKRGSDQTLVLESQIVLFEFPKEMRTSLELLTIPIRIMKLISVTTKLYSQYGLIKGMHQVSQLTPITVTKAVQLEFGRRPLSVLQKAGRAATTALKVKRSTEAVPKLATKAGRKKKAIEVDDEVRDITPLAFNTRAKKAKN
ncbi:uncharacterized protein PAC_13328 [Phialocephala subalpina]|uniref:Integrase catalytic domain-containing protein n=1 Tax=Phialocephala subalpina TaxID=576137 RepID=A0A1L7XEH7_9HELO|nr:uncharacterized protein PAC_13328 [Phialocephala subalpina]